MQVLVVCSQADEASLLLYALRRAEIEATAMPELERAMQAFVDSPTDLVLLGLRQGPLAVPVRRVRRDSQVPLVVIARAWDEDELCEALAAGADVALARPYSLRVLVEQVKALLRRCAGTPLSLLPSFRLGELCLDPATRTVQLEGHPVRRLTQLEFRLLYLLMLHRGQTVPTDIIVERVWGYEADAGPELVRGLVRRLRTKVEPDPRVPRYIVTDPAIGYRLDLPRD
jgi:DNA-binding response OmpR family regulator